MNDAATSNRRSLTRTTTSTVDQTGGEPNGNGFEEEEEAEECDVDAWNTLCRTFRQAQSVLDQNRVLIDQVNENHRSKIHKNLVQNVALIRQINGNISKVLSIYSDLSLTFADVVRQRKLSKKAESSNGEDEGGKKKDNKRRIESMN